jgi:CubicO group peptidase (beta-lactamase class C family)
MRLHYSTAALLLLAPSLVAAQPRAVSNGAARSTGNGAFHADRLQRIDQWLQGIVDAKRAPGVVAMIVRDGKVEYHKAFGVRDITGTTPMRTDDIFRIASQTKAITSVAAMMLWEEGKFGLDDPVGRYIPAFAQQRVLTKFNPADSTFETDTVPRRITIRQLLTHTSGLDYAEIGSAPFRAIYAKAGLSAIGTEGALLATDMDKLGKLPLAHAPGQRFTYSLGVDVLGRLVEVASGMPLDQFFRTRIFAPLKMNDTWFELPAEKRSRLVTLHEESGGKLAPAKGSLGASADYPARKVTYFSGGGGLSSTTGDYARFLQMMLNGGELDGVRLLGRKTVELMLTNQVASIQGAFGLGFALETPENDHRSVVSLGTFSWSGAFKTYYWVDPKERLVGLIYTNMSGGAPIDGPFKTFVYQALK